MNIRKIFNPILVLFFAFSLLGSPVPVLAQESVPTPVFNIRPNIDQIIASMWTMGDNLTLEIDNPTTGDDPDYTLTRTVTDVAPWDPSQTFVEFMLFGVYDIQTGDIVRLSNGTITKMTIVTQLAITNVHINTDLVEGIAAPGQTLHLWTCPLGPCVERDETADQDGHWATSFAVPGEKDWEQTTSDIQPGSWVDSSTMDSDGDSTMFMFNVPNPVIVAFHDNNSLGGDDWPRDMPVTVTIDDPANGLGVDFTDIQLSGDRPWAPQGTWIEFDLNGFDLKPGDLITYDNGETIKSHTVMNLTTTSIDLANDTLSGTADPGAEVQVWVNNPFGSMNRYTTADTNGFWSVDYSVPGNNSDEQSVVDITGGTEGQVKAYDDAGNSTQIGWDVLNPFVIVSPEEDGVFGFDWPMGALLTLEIDDPETSQTPDYTASQEFVESDDWGNGFELSGVFDIQPGHLVTLRDENITKQHTVTNLTVLDIDMDADTVSGTGYPGFEIHVGLLCDDTGCTSRNMIVDENGNWLADFSVPGSRESETVFDIRPGSGTGVYEIDEDGDATNVGWNLPNPVFQVRANDDRIEGSEWILGSTITIEIDDPATQANPDYTDTATVGLADWDPSQTYFGINTDNYDLKLGDIVTVTDGDITKQLTVSNLMITDVNLNTDLIYGIADPGQHVNIWTCWQGDPCVNREETANEDGNWVTNFAIPGEQDWEQGTADLRTGSWIDSSVNDYDGDSTMFGWYVPIPNIEANPGNDWVVARGWPNGTVLTLTIDDPSNGPSIDKTMNITMGPSSWDPNDIAAATTPMDDFDLQPGHVIKVTDGITEAVYVPTNLTVTGFDLEADTISGIASPGVAVEVWVGVSGPHILRHITSDAVTGNWTADYGHFGTRDDEQQLVDLKVGSVGFVKEIDTNGNATHVNWSVPDNQPPVANAGPDQSVYALDPVMLDASASSDPNGDTLTYEWDLDNDGEYDDASGVTVMTAFSLVGNHTVGLQVTDDGGLSATDTVTVTVFPWTLKGFYRPVDMNGVYNIVKGGSTVPLKFEIFAGSTELIDTTAVKSLTFAQTACNANAITDEIEAVATGGTSLRYDAASGQFIFNWKTPKTAGKCYRVTMTAMDGSYLVAYFKLK